MNYLLNISYECDIKKYNNHYKIIYLIIASHNKYYNFFKEQLLKYIVLFKDIKYFFIYNDPTIEYDAIVKEDTIIYKYEENYIPGIFYKSIASMKICNMNFSYDYIIRTNLSSFWNIPVLVDYLKNKPLINFAGAMIDISNEFIDFIDYNEKNNQKKRQVIFLDGAGIILSNDVVNKILELIYDKKILMNASLKIIKNAYPMYLDEDFSEIKISNLLSLPDDVAITLIINNFMSINKFTRLGRIDCMGIIDFNKLSYNSNIFHIRNRTDFIYKNREVDMENIKNLISYFYKIN